MKSKLQLAYVFLGVVVQGSRRKKKQKNYQCYGALLWSEITPIDLTMGLVAVQGSKVHNVVH